MRVNSFLIILLLNFLVVEKTQANICDPKDLLREMSSSRKLTPKRRLPYEEQRLRKFFSSIPDKTLNHVMEVDGGFRVFRIVNGRFEAKTYYNLREAKIALKRISQPLNLGNLAVKYAKELRGIRATIAQVVKGMDVTVDQRVKDAISAKKKIFRKIDEYEKMNTQYSFAVMDDFIGARIVTQSKEESQRVLKSLRKKLGPQIKRVERINKVNGSGYRAIHIIALTNSGQKYEIQVMSKMMRAWHKWDHEHVYKTKHPKGDYLIKLKQYSKALIKYTRNLEDGKTAELPNYEDFGIEPVDRFIE